MTGGGSAGSSAMANLVYTIINPDGKSTRNSNAGTLVKHHHLYSSAFSVTKCARRQCFGKQLVGEVCKTTVFGQSIYDEVCKTTGVNRLKKKGPT